jgi:spore coat protein A
MKRAPFLLGCIGILFAADVLLAREWKSYVTPRLEIPAAFQVPLPIPPTLAPTSSNATTDFYTITMEVGQKEILPGILTTIWGYNGQYPGPTIRAQRGRKTVVRQVNHLQESMVVHLHGGHTPRKSDGLPFDLIGPGGFQDYEYPNNQEAATLWYHDHAADTTGRHVYMGLAGFYLVSDRREEKLALPSGENDVPLLIQDRLFNSDGSLNYTLDDDTILRGVVGDTLLVNGAIQPYFQVPRRKVRFRILNGSNARIYRFALSTGEPLLQIASDGGFLATPVSRSSITVAPGERIEVVIDFANYALGASLTLKNLETSFTPVISDVIRFDVNREARDDSVVPARLSGSLPLPGKATPFVHSILRHFSLEPGTINGRTVWTINGLLYDPQRIDAKPRLNTTETWTFQNNSGQPHPMHIHNIQWRIVDVNGVPPAAGDDGWKDTFLVPARGVVRVIGTFIDNVGLYVSHCHNLEHEDHAMMFNFEVQP